MSLYLFILSMEFLTKSLDIGAQDRRLQGIKLAATAPIITHSIYADDLVIFAQAEKEEVHELKKILKEFGDALGLSINPNISRIWFSSKCSQACKDEVLHHMHASLAREEEKYLGIIV
jgi:Reverse transcriptase (RNA-dependent DNA polymerase)